MLRVCVLQKHKTFHRLQRDRPFQHTVYVCASKKFVHEIFSGWAASESLTRYILLHTPTQNILLLWCLRDSASREYVILEQLVYFHRQIFCIIFIFCYSCEDKYFIVVIIRIPAMAECSRHFFVFIFKILFDMHWKYVNSESTEKFEIVVEIAGSAHHWPTKCTMFAWCLCRPNVLRKAEGMTQSNADFQSMHLRCVQSPWTMNGNHRWLCHGNDIRAIRCSLHVQHSTAYIPAKQK